MARKIIIFVNGYPLAGKDTFVAICRTLFARKGWNSSAASMVDVPLEMLQVADIDVSNKTPYDRALMADIIAALERNERRLSHRLVSDAHLSAMMHAGDFVAFIHAREPAAINLMVALAQGVGFETITAFVDRPNENREWSNAADANVENFTYNMVVKNFGTLEDLQASTSGFVKVITEGMSNA